jgi:hypothetical protein
MANTYILISSNVLTSAAASVTFSSIPATYTDLVLRIGARASAASIYPDGLQTTFNGSSAANYSQTFLYADAATPSSSGYSNQTLMNILASVNGGTSTSNTFSNIEIYIPNYAGSTNKNLNTSVVAETNSASNLVWNIGSYAGLWSNTSAISSIAFNCGSNLETGSSFYLYGIKKN